MRLTRALAILVTLAALPVSAFSETDVQLGGPHIERPLPAELSDVLNAQAAILGGTHAAGGHFSSWVPDTCPDMRLAMRAIDARMQALLARVTVEDAPLREWVTTMRMIEEYRLNARAIDELYERSCKPGA